MLKLIKKYKKISIVVLIFLLLFFVIFMPLILNWIYYLDAPSKFFEVGYNISNILEYYAATLTFIGTLILGSITVYQNYLAQKKTDEVNRLTLELQKKSMAMAEQSYNKAMNRNIPKFELKSRGSNGHYMNLQAELKNVSDTIVSGIKSVSFEIFNESDVLVKTSDQVKSTKSSLLSGQETKIEFHNEELKFKKTNNVYGHQEYESLKNFTIIWKFKCDDSYGNTHYYRAKLPNVEDSSKWSGDLWVVDKVG